jgi:hypothetical protein
MEEVYHHIMTGRCAPAIGRDLIRENSREGRHV